MDEVKKTGICRVCLTKVKKKAMSLFQEYKDSKIFNHVNSIANIQIKENDGLPDRICPSCVLDLETAIHFRQKCESSNIILHSSLHTAVEIIDSKEVIVKKEEPLDEYFDADTNYFNSDLYDIDDEDTKPLKYLNKVEVAIKPSRAIDLHLQCDDCKEFFKSKCKLRVHWKKVHMTDNLKCHSCKRTFKSFKAYHSHQKRKRLSCVNAGNFRIEGEGKARVFYCKECPYKSHRIKDMISHRVTHTGDRPYKCDICAKTCTQLSSLIAHKESAHQEYKVEIACHVCGKLVKGRNRMYRHFKTHNSKGAQCPVCLKMLASKNSVRVHMQRHTGVKSFTCERCAMTFYTSAELANHKRQVHFKHLHWYKCDICGYKSHRNEIIKRHKAKHTDTNIPCTVCGMFCDNAQKLLLHQRRHFDEKKYSCPHCEMKFYRRDSIGKHIRAKHKCTLLINKKPLKQETPEPLHREHKLNQYDVVIEIVMPPGNTA